MESSRPPATSTPAPAAPAATAARPERIPRWDVSTSSRPKSIAERLPAVSLPKSGGAIRGMGEKFSVNAATGTTSLSVPVTTSPGRSGFGPELKLTYESGGGNGPFGFGWSINLPSITRKTDKGLPTYDDANESDVFVLAGNEDLVPVPDDAGHRLHRPRTVHGVDYDVQFYRPRIEGLFARIERWVELATGQSHFRSISRDNVTTLYGLDTDSRIADPAAPAHVFTYLICRTFDDKGNIAVYDYVREADDSANIDLAPAHEANRGDAGRISQRYLKSIRYGNAQPYFADWSEHGAEPALPTVWHFQIVLDYGDHSAATPVPTPDLIWSERPDPFSSYRSCFEVRTYRRCRRILLFHHFQAEPNVGNDCLVRSTDLTYSDEIAPADPRNPIYTFVHSIRHTGYRRAGGAYRSGSLPPIEFEYSEPVVSADVLTLDAGSLTNLPEGLDGSRFQWMDLNGDGVSGVLAPSDGAWYFKPNVSPTNDVAQPDGSTAVRARLGDLQPVVSMPSAGDLEDGQQLLDLSGDGKLDVVSFSREPAGFFERTAEESWSPFRSFESLPQVKWDDPNLKFIDLSGDGLADILFSEDGLFTVYQSLGEAGFGPAQLVRQASDEERGPHLVLADGSQTVLLADLTGDGLNDIVRVRNGETCYWPSLGYGRFGAKVIMDGSPRFCDEERFDPRRVKLTDVDGSGTSDILYVGEDGVSVWFNRSGNSWAAPRRLAVFPDADNLSTVQTLDLLGYGTACLVWSSPLPGHATGPVRYVDLMSGQKPHLLTRIRNNLGAETRLRYAPSTRFSLADKQNGTPWVTKLPFPVQCVERSEVFDFVGRSRFVTRYAYHHGYFDGYEREFRGFGMVEQSDTEEHRADTAFPEVQDDNWDDTSWTPPVRLRTWFHTGAFVEAGIVSRQYAHEYWIEPSLRDVVPLGADLGLTADQRRAAREAMLLRDTVLPVGLTPDETREAYRALKGQTLRTELYADDGSTVSGNPYLVTEQNFTLERLQAMGPNRYAVFFSHPRESFSFNYERRAADPRVSHDATLEVDRFGNVLRRVSAGYPRRAGFAAPEPALSAQYQGMLNYDQTRLHVVGTENRFTNDLTDFVLSPDVHRVPQQAELIKGEITGFKPAVDNQGATDVFRFEELDAAWAAVWNPAHDIDPELVPGADVDGAGAPSAAQTRRVIERSRTIYRANDLTALLALGVTQSQALPGDVYTLAFTPSQVTRVFGARVPDATLSEGAYVQIDGLWWAASGRLFYSAGAGDDPATELAHARAHFYLPVRAVDPYSATSRIVFDDYDILPVSSTDPVGNASQAENDYRVLMPTALIDANLNRSEAAFDTLGVVAGTAMRGKAGQDLGDSLAGFEADIDEPTLLTHLADPLADPAAMLGNATSRTLYDLLAYQRTRESAQPQPPAAYILTRETHVAQLAGGATRYQHSFAYSDGTGLEVQRKLLATDGPLAEGGPDVTRWIVSGWTIFNNKGKPVRRYEPFYSGTPAFEFAAITGVSSILFYDPPGRLMGTLNPDNTWQKTVFTAWRQESWDGGDTVSIANPRTDADLGDQFQRLLGAGSFTSWRDQRSGGAFGATAEERSANRDAAQKAEAYAGTPTLSHFDSLGRLCLTVRDNGGAQRFPERKALDCRGNLLALFDALGRRVFEYCLREPIEGGGIRFVLGYDLTGTLIYRNGMDGGERRSLTSVAAKLYRLFDARDQAFHWRFDAIQRPTQVFVSTGAAAEVLLERLIYGEGMTDDNRAGRLFRHYDEGGLIERLHYDVKGNLARTARTLAGNYRTGVDWSPLTNLTATADLDAAAAPLLVAADSFVSSTAYDALNRPVQVVQPHSGTMRPSVLQSRYNQEKLLAGIDAWLRQADEPAQLLDGATADLHPVGNVAYNARGQRTLVSLGNGVGTAYHYDPDTFRLVRITTTRPNLDADQRTVQDLSYAFDPAGNVTFMRDDADIHNVIYFRNRRVEPSADYTYDPLYRLTHATGREHLGQNGGGLNPPQQLTSDDLSRTGLAHPNDGNAMGTYDESYTYDAVGNIQTMLHQVASGSWTRRYAYAGGSNRLLSTSLPGDPDGGPYTGAYTHDGHGNMTRMPHLPSLTWDEQDRLRSTTRQVVNAGTPETTYYTYDAGGERLCKATDHAAAEGAAPVRRRARLYLGGIELYREYGVDGVTVALEREALHVMDGQDRVLLVETRTAGNDPAPVQLARYQHANHLGTALLELDKAADIISYEEYFPHGSTSCQAMRSQLETPKRYRYTGKERDDENDLYYQGKRYCAPWLGRWTAADPANVKDDLNLYQYVSNNPVRLMDPTGTDGWDRFWGGVKMVGGAVETVAGAALVAAGAATSEVGVGIPIAAAGVFVTAHGADVTVSGARTMWNGAPVDTLTSTGLQAAGMSRTAAILTDAGISVVGTLGAGAITRAPTAAAAIADSATATEGAAQTTNSVSVAFKAGGLGPGHNMVGVTTEAGTQWTHLVKLTSAEGVATGASEVVTASGPSAAYTVVTVPRTAAQATAALEAGQSSIGTVAPYALGANDCATYASSVLRAGGVVTPPLTTPAVNLASVALQSPAVMGPVSIAGAGVTTAVAGNALYSAATSPSSSSTGQTSSSSPDSSSAVSYTPVDSSDMVCTQDDTRQNYEDMVCQQ